MNVDERRGDLFDVAIGVYDGAELCELVSTFLLEKSVKSVTKLTTDLQNGS